MNKFDVADLLNRRLKKDGKLVGVAAGNGMTAKYAEEGGADFILALSSGRFRQMGVSSLTGFLPYANSNEIVMEFASKELIPRINDIPICFGLCATDPTIQLANYIEFIKSRGFAGINNFPSVGLFDGIFGESLEEQGISYALEVEAIRIASEKELFTVAFVFNEEQAVSMINAGADVICVHLGLTQGGTLGAKNILSLQSAKKLAVKIFDRCDELNTNIIKMVYGGPVNKPVDVQFMYDGTNIMGYIGGSVFERIATEQMLIEITKSFKQTNDFHYDELIRKVMNGIGNHEDYIDFIKKYISLNYMNEITLNEIVEILNLSRSYVSTLFKKEVGISFTQYLIEYRLNRALEIMELENLPLNRVAEMTGYQDYSQFSKIFKKYKGVSPKEILDKK
ncbi:MULTISPECIES: phosphoenolpyruvate hydrolase family protein [unclassified Sporosarcina]|uniref:phosphoenolpyruvate hydrolase family protein n=1 Tax=unclassified Sporosarcina TaxID=2647733 RepID=UPI00203B21D9|nr:MULTISPECIES: phosphoenolpyruvate hydrolase family protein [unclassified Sporosarcina]GKV67409.1 AraC family transcriptional regulator [Sporosarcina sp. NCCP-2331]GLB57765.1 AraC family transcriptional regulator [Sporosarcina sp. NCCP-2378]